MAVRTAPTANLSLCFSLWARTILRVESGEDQSSSDIQTHYLDERDWEAVEMRVRGDIDRRSPVARSDV